MVEKSKLWGRFDLEKRNIVPDDLILGKSTHLVVCDSLRVIKEMKIIWVGV